MGDELRKVLEQIVCFGVWAAPQVAEGGGGNSRNPRQDIRRNIATADPIARRLHRAKIPEAASTRGTIRFGANRPLNFTDIKEPIWDIEYMRSHLSRRMGDLHRKASANFRPVEGK